jgi:DNA helicase-2/ATP-dependent DNA helicase PcrA
MENPLKRYRGDIYHDADRLAGLFTAMKLEAWQPDWMLEEIDNYVIEINSESGGFYNKTKLKKGILELTSKGKGELKKMVTLKAAVQSFNSYQQILQKYKRYDFFRYDQLGDSAFSGAARCIIKLSGTISIYFG